MLAYHPAFDPYHTAFRLVRLLTAQPNGYPEDKARVLDFYLLFPEAIQAIRLPRQLVRWRRWSEALANQYWFNGDQWSVFTRMKPFFDTATGLLYSSHVLERASYEDGLLRLDTDRELSIQLSAHARQRNDADSDLMDLLVHELGAIPLTGRDGLKDRTSLLEFRYDAV